MPRYLRQFQCLIQSFYAACRLHVSQLHRPLKAWIRSLSLRIRFTSTVSCYFCLIVSQSEVYVLTFYTPPFLCYYNHVSRQLHVCLKWTLNQSAANCNAFRLCIYITECYYHSVQTCSIAVSFQHSLKFDWVKAIISCQRPAILTYTYGAPNSPGFFGPRFSSGSVKLPCHTRLNFPKKPCEVLRYQWDRMENIGLCCYVNIDWSGLASPRSKSTCAVGNIS